MDIIKYRITSVSNHKIKRFNSDVFPNLYSYDEIYTYIASFSVAVNVVRSSNTVSSEVQAIISTEGA